MARARKKSTTKEGAPVRSAGTTRELWSRFERALAARDGGAGALAIHELWMRGEMGLNVERALDRLWQAAAESVPEWLPTRHVAWLPVAYDVAATFRPRRRGTSNVYLILLDYSDGNGDPHGVYVGMSAHPAADRYEQHMAGIRAAGSVTKRGLEPLTGPVAHLQRISRTEAVRIEAELAEALRTAGVRVQGGH